MIDQMFDKHCIYIVFYYRKLATEENIGKKKELVQKIIDGKLNKRLQDLSILGTNHVVEANNPKIDKFLLELGKKYNNSFSINQFYNWKVEKDLPIA